MKEGDIAREIAHLIVEHLKDDMTNAFEVGLIIARRERAILQEALALDLLKYDQPDNDNQSRS